jgi:hypothetical protein
LENILKKNFMLSYTIVGNDKKLVGIWIASRSEFRRTFETTNSPSVIREAHAEKVQDWDRPWVRKDVMASFEGNEWQPEPMPVDPGTEINLAEAPSSVRLKAIEFLATHAENNQDVITTLSHFAHTDPDPQVREMASRVLNDVQ